MDNICEMLSDVSKIEQEPKMMGKRATMLLAPDKGKKEATDSKREKEAAEEQAATTN